MHQLKDFVEDRLRLVVWEVSLVFF